MPTTPRNSWPTPQEGENPFFQAFETMAAAIDATVHAGREDAQTVLTGGGTVAWDAGTDMLSWSATIEIPATMAGFLWQLPAGSIAIEDGEALYTTLTHAPLSNITVTAAAASQVPVGDAYFLLGFRRGTRIYFRNGKVINDGEASALFGSTDGVVTAVRTAAYIATADDSLVLADPATAAGSFAVTLPAANAARLLTVKVTAIDATKVVTVVRAGSDTIEGVTAGQTVSTFTTTANLASATFQSDGGTKWYLISSNGTVT